MEHGHQVAELDNNSLYIRGATTLLVAAVATSNSLVVQASLFQLTHMSRDDHAQSIELAMAANGLGKTKNYYSAHNFASTVSFGM